MESNDYNSQAGLSIAREAEERTGTLDLGRLGLTELPEELFGLIHLQRLNLGYRFLDERGKWVDTTSVGHRNGPIVNLVRLQSAILIMASSR